jgi:pimeloyl-ACP methyl ester carboxylesterase
MSPEKAWTDCGAPLNLVLHREPSMIYPNQYVNLWIDKPWNPELDNIRIPCRYEKFERNRVFDDLENSKLIIYSHDNQNNILTSLPFIQILSKTTQADVVTYDYSGYGLNKYNSYERSADGINATLRAVYNHFISKGTSANDISLLGYSLGSGPSVNLAAHSALGGLALISSYSSILDVVKESIVPKLGTDAASYITGMFSERWNNLRTITEVKIPILMIYGKYDQMIPAKTAHKLKQAASNATFVEVDSGHSNFNWEEVVQHIVNWRETNFI